MAKVLKQQRLLGEFLIDNKLITPEQLEQALRVQQETGERLGKILINLGYISEQDVVDILEHQLGIPQVSLSAVKLNPVLIESVPEQLICRHKAIPIKKEGKKLIVAMADPLNVVALDDLRLTTGLEIEPVLSSEKEIEAAIQRHFGLPGLEKAVLEVEAPVVSQMEAVRLDEVEEEAADEAPVVRLANSIIIQAINEQASDIHIEPQQENVRVRFRIDGMLRDAMTVPRKFRSPLISRIKIMADMDIAERRVPQDGRILIRYRDRDVDLRVSTMPAVFGEKVVIRVLDKGKMLLRVDQLGFYEENLARFKEIIRHSYGMVLITGPTGSGKTTTLYAILSEISSPELNVITIEDPVEYLLPGVTQVQINPKAGLTFARGLRAIVRQDPDVVMVGEIRDGETAEIAVRAAMTGHLVLSTMHTNDAAAGLTRLLHLGIEPFLVASTVLGVTAQRLVRVICPRCREPYELKPGARERFFMGVSSTEPVTLYRGRGCRHCQNIGYRGQTSICEVLPVTPAIRELIAQKATGAAIRQQAVAEGMRPLREDGVRKALRGITAIEEVMRVAYVEE
ncbi:MAG TPA: type II secretion system protein GspE [Desulfotomaculum sp.]|nr:type II secretion system protein GspE [Desulfotomaculum sp.]